MLAVAGDATLAPPSAKSIYAFEIDLLDIARLARRRLSELESRREQLNIETNAR